MESKREVEQQQNEKHSFKNYGDPQYWNIRYKKAEGQRFDWLQNFEALQQLIDQTLGSNKLSKILNIGCGNGEIQDKLYQNGYHNIVNNDISPIVINQMQKIKHQKHYNQMVFEVMDVRQMKYQDNSFDMVIDKSTIDALLCSDTPLVSVAMMLYQIYRVLKIGKTYFMISYGTPDNRMQHLIREHISFDIEVVQLVRECQDNGGKLIHYVYICKKIPMKKQFGKQDYKKLLIQLKQIQQQNN